MTKKPSILDKNLSKGKNEISLSTYALLFSEMVKYAQARSQTTDNVRERLARYGKSVGVRLLDVITLREKGYKRETKHLAMLMFIKSTVWKNVFYKEADKLERSNDDPKTYLLIEKNPLVNTYISLPTSDSMNCAAFTAGMIEAMLEVSNFPCKVTAHWHDGTTYVIQFDESVLARENALSESGR